MACDSNKRKCAYNLRAYKYSTNVEYVTARK